MKKRENEYYVGRNDHVISPSRQLITSKFTIKLRWTGEHYDTLIEEPSFKGIYLISSKLLHWFFLNKTWSLPDICQTASLV